MYLGLSTSLGSVSHSPVQTGSGTPSVFGLLGNRNGFAIDFVNKSMRINDAGNPLNGFVGDPEAKLTVFGNDGYQYDPVKGLAVDASRDFSVALSTALFPYNPAACTVYIKYTLNAANSADQRYLFMADNGGNDRFATYSTSGSGFRFVTGDGTAVDIALSSFAPVAGTELTAVFGADANGKTYVDDGGIVTDAASILAASIPLHVGIGGYDDRVLRVLDGHIREIMVITEPVEKVDRLTLTPNPPGNQGSGPAEPEAFSILGERNGFAIDFVAGQMRVNDTVTPSNAFEGDPEQLLTVYGTDPYLYDPSHGLRIDATRDFSIALSTALFPYNPAACSVYAKYRLNSGLSSEQRYLVMADNAGNDRFALYSTSNGPMRFVTGDGSAADISASSQVHVANTTYRAIFGADINGKTFVDESGVVADDPDVLAASAPSYLGIGGYNDRVLRVLDGTLQEIVVVTEPLIKSARLSIDGFKHVYKAEGDSHTFNGSYGLPLEGFYPALVAGALGADFVGLNHGVSGDSTSEMVNRIPDLLAGGRPDIVTIYGGSNDNTTTVANLPAPTTTSFGVSGTFRHAPGGWLVVNGESVEVVAVNGTEVTVSPALSVAPSAGATITFDTVKNLQLWVQAMKSAGCEKILIIGSHYLNFASSGDTPTSQQSLRASMRLNQQAAATAENVPYVDTYAFMRDMVLNGDVVAGDDLAWHVAVGNTHLNAAGEQALADAVFAAMAALGWT